MPVNSGTVKTVPFHVSSTNFPNKPIRSIILRGNGDGNGRIREKLSLAPDYRHPSYVGHKLSDVLIIVMTN